MVFTALSSFNGVGINTLHFAMSAFFIYYLFIYLFIHFIYFILFFVPFHLRVGSDCFISRQ